MKTTNFNFLANFDFAVLEDENFKEDSVREFIIAPILKELGFEIKDDKNPKKLEISLSKTKKAEVKIGSNKSFQANLTPDYTLYVNSKIHCVLDAKAPAKSVEKGSEAFKQVLSYATHFNSSYFALCNGYKFMLFHIDGQRLVLEVNLKKELEHKFETLKAYLTTIKTPKESPKISKQDDKWYLDRKLPEAIVKLEKRK